MSTHLSSKIRLERTRTLIGTSARARSSIVNATGPRSMQRVLQTVVEGPYQLMFDCRFERTRTLVAALPYVRKIGKTFAENLLFRTPWVAFDRARLDDTCQRSSTCQHIFHEKLNSSAFVLWWVRAPVLDRRPSLPPDRARREVGRKWSCRFRTNLCSTANPSAQRLRTRPVET